MRVRCIATSIEDPCEELINSGWKQAIGYLTVGREYEVYAIYFSYIHGHDAYLVCDDIYNDKDYYWPIFIPACYFEIIDRTIPTFWKTMAEYPGYLGPDELGPEKYEALVDGDMEVLSSFRRLINVKFQ